MKTRHCQTPPNSTHVVTAAQVTSAAVGYIEIDKTKKETIEQVDGAFTSNNPLSSLMVEMMRMCRKDICCKPSHIFSLGTGKSAPIFFDATQIDIHRPSSCCDFVRVCRNIPTMFEMLINEVTECNQLRQEAPRTAIEFCGGLVLRVSPRLPEFLGLDENDSRKISRAMRRVKLFLISIHPKVEKMLRGVVEIGGGIRGILQTTMLIHMENVLGDIVNEGKANAEDFDHPKITEYVDWVAGTSVRGLLALALSQGKSTKECSQLIMQLKIIVFQGKRPYSAEILRETFENVYGKDTMSSLTDMK